MIISDKVLINIKKGNFGHYHKISKDIKIGFPLEIPIFLLPKSSNFLIKASCEYCKNIVEISYKLYNKRIKKHNKFACSKKCAAIRTKEELFEKYGVKNIAQVPNIKEKIKKVNLEKYG